MRLTATAWGVSPRRVQSSGAQVAEAFLEESVRRAGGLRSWPSAMAMGPSRWGICNFMDGKWLAEYGMAQTLVAPTPTPTPTPTPPRCPRAIAARARRQTAGWRPRLTGTEEGITRHQHRCDNSPSAEHAPETTVNIPTMLSPLLFPQPWAAPRRLALSTMQVEPEAVAGPVPCGRGPPPAATIVMHGAPTPSFRRH